MLPSYSALLGLLLVSFLLFERQFSRANPSLVRGEREREREAGRGAEIKMSSVFSIAAAVAAAASQKMIPRTGTWESVSGLIALARIGAAGNVNSDIFQKIHSLGPILSSAGIAHMVFCFIAF